MRTYKPTRIRLMTYYVMQSFIMATAFTAGSLITDLINQSVIEISGLGGIFLPYFIVGLVFLPLAYGGSEDSFSITLTGTTITGRDLGLTSFDMLTFEFSDIEKIAVRRPRWLGSSKIFSKNKESIVIHPSISNDDYKQIITYLKEKGI